MNSSEQERWRAFACTNGDLDSELEAAETAVLHELAGASPAQLEGLRQARAALQAAAPPRGHKRPDAIRVDVPHGEHLYRLRASHLVIALSLPIDDARDLLGVWNDFAAREEWDEQAYMLFVPLFELLGRLLGDVDLGD